MYPYRNFDAITYQKHYRELAPNFLRELLLTPTDYLQESELKAAFDKIIAYAHDGNQACQDFLIHECQFLDVPEGFLTNKMALAERAFQQHRSPAVALILFEAKLKNNQLDEAVKCLTVALSSDDEQVQLDLRYMFQPYHLAFLCKDKQFNYIMTHCPELIAWLQASGFAHSNKDTENKHGESNLDFIDVVDNLFYQIERQEYERASSTLLAAIRLNKYDLDIILLRIFTGFIDDFDRSKVLKLLKKVFDFKHNSPEFNYYIKQHPLLASVAEDAALVTIESCQALYHEKRKEVIAQLIGNGDIESESGDGSNDEGINVEDIWVPVFEANNLAALNFIFPLLTNRSFFAEEELSTSSFEQILLSEEPHNFLDKTIKRLFLTSNNSHAALIKLNLSLFFYNSDRERLKEYFMAALAHQEMDVIAHLIAAIAQQLFNNNVSYLDKFKSLCPQSQQFLMDYVNYFPKIMTLYPDLVVPNAIETVAAEPISAQTHSLTDAVLASSLSDVRYHLQQGANPHERRVARNMENHHFYLKTPLHQAVEQGDSAVVNELLAYIGKYRLPARVYFKNQTPLDLAISLNHQEIIASLQAFESSVRPDFFAQFSHLPSYRPFWQHEEDKQQKILCVLLQSLAAGKHELVQHLLKKHPMTLCLPPSPNSLAGHLFSSSAFEYAWLSYDANVLGSMLACLPDTHEGLQIKDLVREQMAAMSNPLTANKSLLALCESKKAVVDALLAAIDPPPLGRQKISG